MNCAVLYMGIVTNTETLTTYHFRAQLGTQYWYSKTFTPEMSRYLPYCIFYSKGIRQQLIIKYLTLCNAAWQKGYQLKAP